MRHNLAFVARRNEARRNRIRAVTIFLRTDANTMQGTLGSRQLT
jgi:hypothetical protein